MQTSHARILEADGTADERAADTSPTASRFEAPGPGSWEQDPAHFPRPVSPWAAGIFSSGFPRGFAESTRRYGVLLDRLEPAVIGGYMYYRSVPAADPAGGDAAHEEMERRLRASANAFERKLWRHDLELWDEGYKPDSIRRNRLLQSVDLAALSDSGLGSHLAGCFENHEEMAYRHHKFNMAAMLPVGRFVAEAAKWTGRSRSDLLGLLRGASPVSNGIAARELEAVGRALRAAGIAPADFAGADASVVLEHLRNHPGEVGRSVREYLDECGAHVASGYDVTDLTTLELPHMVVAAFWQARESAGRPGDGPSAAARIEEVRRSLSPERRREFDELLGEARLVNRLRDERGIYNDLWASGISRRAIQEAGRRLALRGVLDEAELLFEATCTEMISLLEGAARPAGDELAARARARRPLPAEAVPLVVGDAPVPPPPADELPEPARFFAEALGVVLEEILGSAVEPNEERRLRGKAVSPGIYEGPARVVANTADFDRIEPGDVLVTSSTSAAFNVVLPLLGAIVTDRGALLSHAAIVAREYGLPGVVGTREATKRIPDGARIRVDGNRGTVEVLR